MKLSSFVAVIGAAVSIVLGFLLFRAQREAALSRAEVEALRAATNALAMQVTDANVQRVDQAKLDRLQADQREAIKLRGENAALKTQLAAAKGAKPAAVNSPPASEPAAAAAPLPPEQNPAVRVMNTKVVSNLQPGQAMILGGWETQPGKRTFAFMAPTVDASNPNGITVDAKWVEVSNEAATALNLNLVTAGQQAALSPEQFAALMKAFEQTPGVDILSSPKVVTQSGAHAQMAISHILPTPNGDVSLGPSFDLVPTQRPDGSVDLAVDATLTLPANPE